MNETRRTVLKRAGVTGALAAAFAAGLLRWQDLLAAGWNKDAFGSKTLADALKGIGAGSAADSKEIVIEVPQIAENGGVVPIEVTSKLPGTRSIAVLIEKNPFPLVAKFDFLEGAMPFVKLNVKMGETSNVRVVAEAGGKFFTTVKEVKVTIGGCGG
jgi:sulfur-oxidizing protein SoxY